MALFVLWAGVLGALFRPELRGMDTVGHYAWLRSAVIQGSLDVSDELGRSGYLSERGPSPTGYRLNEWPVGVPLLWSPFFLAAHVLVWIANGFGIPVPADGYSAPYLVLTAVGLALYALLGLEPLRQMVIDAAFWATVTAWLPSPPVFYVSAHPFMATP